MAQCRNSAAGLPAPVSRLKDGGHVSYTHMCLLSIKSCYTCDLPQSGAFKANIRKSFVKPGVSSQYIAKRYICKPGTSKSF